jgi:hypothetical protein
VIDYDAEEAKGTGVDRASSSTLGYQWSSKLESRLGQPKRCTYCPTEPRPRDVQENHYACHSWPDSGLFAGATSSASGVAH